jgi:hypothetical protein
MWKYKSDSVAAEGYYGADARLQEVKQYNGDGDLGNKRYYSTTVSLTRKSVNECSVTPNLIGF